MVPFIVMAMMLIVQFGLAMYARQVVAGAAQDGAAQAALVGSSPAAGQAVTDGLVQQAAGNLLTGYGSSVSSTAEVVTIQASGQVVRVFPLFPTLTVSATGSATIERFRPEGQP